MIRDAHRGSGSRIRILIFYPSPGSRGQKDTAKTDPRFLFEQLWQGFKPVGMSREGEGGGQPAMCVGRRENEGWGIVRGKLACAHTV
jgi:hypothetical protein